MRAVVKKIAGYAVALISAGLFLPFCDGVGGSASYVCYGDNGTTDTCRAVNGTSRESCETEENRIFVEGTCEDVDYPKNCGDYYVQSNDNCL